MTKPLSLMITCDDGGLSRGIDDAVLALYKEGMVSAVSMMTNMPGATTSLDRFSAYPDLEIGVHLNLTEGNPLTTEIQQSGLVDKGRFSGRLTCFMQGLFLTNTLQTQIYDEFNAQMQVFINKNRHPAHITTHHHFHILPGYRRIVYALAREYHVHWVRNSQLSGASIPGNPFIQHNNKSDQPEFFEPDYVVLIQEWLKQPPEVLLRELYRFNGVIELVIHPCTEVDEQFPDSVMYKPQERYREIEFLKALWKQANDQIAVTGATKSHRPGQTHEQ